MPSYCYECSECSQAWNTFHGIDEKEEKCCFCFSEKIKKSFRSMTNNIRPDRVLYPEEKEQIRNRVEKHIEEAREDLKQRIKETRKDYKP